LRTPGCLQVTRTAAELLMPTPPDLKRLAIGERLQDPLLVLEVELKTFGDKECTILTLGNCTGRMASAPFWGTEQSQVAGIARNDVVQVIGEVGLYRERRQLRVASIRPLPRGTVDVRLLLPSVGDVAGYWKTLDGWRDEIDRPRLRHTLALFFDDADFRRRFEECPASPSGHHAELGGLLKHVCEVASIGRAIARTCRADRDLVLAGALLHDIGKLETYRWEGAFDYTDCGRLLGHVVLGALMLDRRLDEEDEPPCNDHERTLLHHLILSHHGKLEFGAAVPPMTLEAEVLHYADDASAKAASMQEALADAENFSGEGLVSARGIWQLDRRRAYRGASDWGRKNGKDGQDGQDGQEARLEGLGAANGNGHLP
jgi:3'-5' exoribonuclease